MFIHPLAREDEHLIQDFMLTKIALLVARHADDQEWLFELQAMDDQSESRGGSAFLFVYTVARYYVAGSRLNVGLGEDEFEPVNDSDAFYGEFAQAVASNDCEKALRLWRSSPHSSQVALAAPPIRRITAVYLEAVAGPDTEAIASKVADHLPAPYASALTL